MLVKAFNPNQYPKLLEHSGKSFLKFLIYTVLLSLLLFIVVTVPTTYLYAQSIPENAGAMEKLTLSGEAEATGPVYLLKQPAVLIDLDANQTRHGVLTLSREGILYPKYLFFGTSFTSWSQLTDLKQETPEKRNVLRNLIIFLLPSIIFWFFLFSSLATAIGLFVLILLGYFLPKLFHHAMSFGEAVKIGLLALPSTLFFSIGFYALDVKSIFWVGIILTVVLFSVGVMVTSELIVPERKHGKV
jgi:hypothetical protein